MTSLLSDYLCTLLLVIDYFNPVNSGTTLLGFSTTNHETSCYATLLSLMSGRTYNLFMRMAKLVKLGRVRSDKTGFESFFSAPEKLGTGEKKFNFQRLKPFFTVNVTIKLHSHHTSAEVINICPIWKQKQRIDRFESTPRSLI